jgi:hypothetical protein
MIIATISYKTTDNMYGGFYFAPVYSFDNFIG